MATSVVGAQLSRLAAGKNDGVGSAHTQWLLWHHSRGSVGSGHAWSGGYAKTGAAAGARASAVDVVGQWDCAVLSYEELMHTPSRAAVALGRSLPRSTSGIAMIVASDRVLSTDVEHGPAVVDETGSSSERSEQARVTRDSVA